MSRLRFIYGALLLFLLFALTSACRKQAQKDFIVSDAHVIALTHVRVIDGTGESPKQDQTILIENGRITAINSASTVAVPAGAKIFDLKDHTAIPGLVGMHDHLFYTTDSGAREVSAAKTFARLYLAAGVTTIRTTGALDLDAELKIKELIDAGDEPGPKIHLSSPYINRPTNEFLDQQKIDKAVEEWAAKGVTGLKAYTNIGRQELTWAIAAGHRHGMKVTGHLCAVGFRDAIAAGIDNLEHGLIVDTEFYSAKRPDQCPARNEWLPELAQLDIKSDPVRDLITDLVQHHVAVTSTLPVFETFLGDRFQLDARLQQVLSADAYRACLSRFEQYKSDTRGAQLWQAAFKKEMEFEREFVLRGGLLIAGVDPTGYGGVVAGFGDQRELELLVEAGFTPLEAIKIYTANGAAFLGESEHIGTLAVGKQADIVIVTGDPSVNIADVWNVNLVFKDGVAFDSAKLIDSVSNQVGTGK